MRFHVGVSFRLKSLKKFLFPILIGVLAYFGFGGLFGFIPVYATSYNNFNTSYTINYDSTYFDDLYDGSQHLTTINSFLQDIISLESNYYELIITYNGYKGYSSQFFQFNLIPKNNYSYLEDSIFSMSTGAFYHNFEYSGKYYYNSNLSNFNTSASWYTNFYNCYIYNSCSNSTSSSRVQLSNATNYSSINNNSSYVFTAIPYTNNSTRTNLLYYSSLPVKFVNSKDYSGYSLYYKNLILESETYTLNDFIPTYYDLYLSTPPIEPTTIEGVQDFYDIFISNVPVSNLSSLVFNYQYQTYTDADYNIYRAQFYKKVDNGTYYSYEDLYCTASINTDTTTSIISGTLNNINCSNLNGATEVFIRLIPTTSAYGKPISEFSYTLNYGYFSIIPIFNGNGQYRIMEHFIDFPADENLILSTTYDWAYSYLKTDSRYLLSCEFNNTTGTATGYCEQPFQFGTSYSSKANIIYNYLPENNNTTTFDLFFSSDVILSNNSNNSSITYYDDSGTITSQVVNNLHQVNSSAYDVDDLFTRVNNYIDSLNDDISSIHDLLEQCFYSLDTTIQLFIIILYILTLSYLLFKVIRR